MCNLHGEVSNVDTQLGRGSHSISRFSTCPPWSTNPQPHHWQPCRSWFGSSCGTSWTDPARTGATTTTRPIIEEVETALAMVLLPICVVQWKLDNKESYLFLALSKLQDWYWRAICRWFPVRHSSCSHSGTLREPLGFLSQSLRSFALIAASSLQTCWWNQYRQLGKLKWRGWYHNQLISTKFNTFDHTWDIIHQTNWPKSKSSHHPPKNPETSFVAKHHS